MPAAAPSAPRAVAVPRRGAAPRPPPSTAAKRARPPLSDSSPLASSPLRRLTNDVIVVSERPYRSPTKRSRTAAETSPLPPSTTPRHDAAPTTPPTPCKTAATHTVPLTTRVPEDVATICDIPDGHADALTAALSIVYNADDRIGATLDMVLQKLFGTITSQALRAATRLQPAADAAATPATATGPPPTYASRLAPQTTPCHNKQTATTATPTLP